MTQKYTIDIVNLLNHPEISKKLHIINHTVDNIPLIETGAINIMIDDSKTYITIVDHLRYLLFKQYDDIRDDQIIKINNEYLIKSKHNPYFGILISESQLKTLFPDYPLQQKPW